MAIVMKWENVNGDLLLCGTGFVIKRDKDNGNAPFTLIDPDGKKSEITVLSVAKNNAETKAKEFAEFNTANFCQCCCKCKNITKTS